MTDDDSGPLNEAEEWRTALVGMQMHFYRSILQLLIEKQVVNHNEGRALMYSIAERMRGGGDRAGAEEVSYLLASMLERIGNDLMDEDLLTDKKG